MIPEYLLTAYKKIPTDRPVSVLMRHSIRYPITNDAEVYTAGLTPEGCDLAKQFGGWLDDTYELGAFSSSPIGRCVDTGIMLAKGAQLERIVKKSPLLGHPNENGEYDTMSDGLATKNWHNHIHDIASFMLPKGQHTSGLNFFFSHDTVIILMAAYWLGFDLRTKEDWPRFLEPFFMYWKNNNLVAVFRNQEYALQNQLNAYKKYFIGFPN